MHKSLNQILIGFAAQTMFPDFLGSAFWVHLASAILFILGICLTFRKMASPSSGLNRIAPFGPVFFSVPLAIFGMQHFVLFNTVKFGVPGWMPGRFFWALIVGTALIATCLSFLADIKAGLAALLVGIMLFLFVLLIYVPNLLQNPHDRFALATPFRDLALCGGALAYAGALGAVGRHRPVRWLVELGRWFFAAPMVLFGVEHFLHPESAPGVPLEMLMPPWVPGHLLVSYLVGAVLVACGASILINQRARMAAIWLGIAYLVLVLFIYMPMEILHPSIEISGELDYVADTLAMSGAALLIARALETLNQSLPSSLTSLKKSRVTTLLLLLLSMMATIATARAQSTPSQNETPEIGIMDVANGNNIAQARIEPVSHGCALREEYRSTDGGGGESLSSWDRGGPEFLCKVQRRTHSTSSSSALSRLYRSS